MIRMETVFDSWRTVRQDTVQALEEFPASELDFRPTPEVMTFGELARHILVAGHGITGVLLTGMENLQTPQFRELLSQHAPQLPESVDAATLASQLRTSLEQRLGELAQQSQDFFSHVITRFDGQRVTRLEMVQFTKEHELTHRSQMFIYLRLKGIVPPTTRRRQAKK